jgi:hypothetical protein
VGAADPGPGGSDFGHASGGAGFGKVVSLVAHGGYPGYAGVSQLVQDEHRGDVFTWPCAKYAHSRNLTSAPGPG